MLRKRDDSCPGGDGKTKMIHVFGVVEQGDKSFILLLKQLTIFTSTNYLFMEFLT